MSDYCKIYYAGSTKAPEPDNWITSTTVGMNRLIYVTGGEGGYIKNDIKIPFKKDCLYLISGNAYFIPTYSSYESEEKRLDHIYANFEIIPPFFSTDIICIDSFDDEEIKVAVETFKTLCKQCALKKGYQNLSEASQKFLKSTVIFLLNKITEKFNCYIIKDQVVLHALKIMHENIGKKQLINEIAKECYLSPNGFIRKFKKEVGETPYSYLKKLKIRTAQNMRLSNATLEEIAEKCGYSDSSALLHAIGKKKK